MYMLIDMRQHATSHQALTSVDRPAARRLRHALCSHDDRRNHFIYPASDKPG